MKSTFLFLIKIVLLSSDGVIITIIIPIINIITVFELD